jgi:hypothetical protein
MELANQNRRCQVQSGTIAMCTNGFDWTTRQVLIHLASLKLLHIHTLNYSVVNCILFHCRQRIRVPKLLQFRDWLQSEASIKCQFNPMQTSLMYTEYLLPKGQSCRSIGHRRLYWDDNRFDEWLRKDQINATSLVLSFGQCDVCVLLVRGRKIKGGTWLRRPDNSWSVRRFWSQNFGDAEWRFTIVFVKRKSLNDIEEKYLNENSR